MLLGQHDVIVHDILPCWKRPTHMMEGLEVSCHEEDFWRIGPVQDNCSNRFLCYLVLMLSTSRQTDRFHQLVGRPHHVSRCHSDVYLPDIRDFLFLLDR